MSSHLDSTTDMFGFGGHLSSEVLLTDAGFSPFGVASGPKTTSFATTAFALSTSTTPTFVTSPGSNLAIDLLWDSSIGSAPAGFKLAVTEAALTLVQDFSTPLHTIDFIKIGWGEVNGTPLAASALGESESAGYLTNYATVASVLSSEGVSLSATNEPVGAQFFLTSAQTKAMGLISGVSGSAASPDGFVGFSTLAGTGKSWSMGLGAAANQYNLEGVALHELTEVMGRISMEGTFNYLGRPTYTPMDLSDFSAPGHLALSPSGGYFSSNNGVTHMGNFNNAAAYGGDIGDWASISSVTQSGTVAANQQDPFDAFTRPGYSLVFPSDDIRLMATLGYLLTAKAAALA